jgi:hypothetical protein
MIPNLEQEDRQMRGVTFDLSINIPTMAGFLAAIVSGGIWMGSIAAESKATAERVTILEAKYGAMPERMVAIEKQSDYIVKALDRMERNQDNEETRR